MKYLFFFLSALLALSCSRVVDLRSGDLVFVVVRSNASGSGSMDTAIIEATGGDGLDVTHVGIVEVQGDSAWVIDATPRLGVARRTLEEFRADALSDTTVTVDLVFRRMKDASLSDNWIGRAKAFVGRGYDHAFLPGNAEIYCSELVQMSYLDSAGVPIFPSTPMNFRGEDGEFSPYWVRTYEKMGISIPQDEPGTNPHDMLLSSFLEDVN